jgi:hypothetical protein
MIVEESMTYDYDRRTAATVTPHQLAVLKALYSTRHREFVIEGEGTRKGSPGRGSIGSGSSRIKVSASTAETLGKSGYIVMYDSEGTRAPKRNVGRDHVYYTQYWRMTPKGVALVESL